MKIFLSHAIFLLIFTGFCPLQSEEAGRPNAPVIQQVVQKLDSRLKYPPGIYEAVLTHTLADGRKIKYDIQMFVSEAGRLTEFKSDIRGPELRLLYLRNGLLIYARDILRQQTEMRRDQGRYKSLLRTGFNYADLSGASLEALYDPQGSYSRQKLVLVPVLPAAYSSLEITGTDEPQVTFDVYDRKRILFKTMLVHFGIEVRNAATNEMFVPQWPVRTEVLDMRYGSMSSIEIFKFNPEVPDQSLFQPDYFDR